jgi:hypothetical protein
LKVAHDGGAVIRILYPEVRIFVPKGTRSKETPMSKLDLIQNIKRTISVGVAAAAVGGLGIVALAGSAPAGATVVNTIPVKVVFPTCPSAVSVSTTYSYSYTNVSTPGLTGSGLITSLSGSGCSRSANPVKITIPALGYTTTVTPTPDGPLAYSFSFTDSHVVGETAVSNTDLEVAYGLYLTQNAANALNPCGSTFGSFGSTPVTINYDASQAATGGTSSMWFTLWSPWILADGCSEG